MPHAWANDTAGRQVRAYYCDQCLPAVWILPLDRLFSTECIGKGPQEAGDFASKQHLSVTKTVVWFTFSIMQLSKGLTTSFLDRNLRFHCHMYCFGALANWEWSNSPLLVTSICSLFPSVSLSWDNWAYSYAQSKNWPWNLEWIVGLSGTLLWQY